MAMHSRDPPDPKRPKTKLSLNSTDLVKLGYASFLKNCQEERSQIDECADESFIQSGIYPICIKQTNIKFKI